MNGPQHREEADLMLSGDPCEYGCPHSGCEHEMSFIARAQVHATLALVDAASARDRLALLRAEHAALLAACRASVAAERSGDADPLGYVRGALEERGQLPRPARARSRWRPTRARRWR